jgi:signal transduction histidine kinase
VQRALPVTGRQYLFAGGVVVLPLLVALGLRALTGSDRWTLDAFVLSTALNIVVAVRARRLALEERSRLLRVAEQARHDVSQLEENQAKALSKLSHDLRTPLSTIVGWAQVLRAQNPPEQMLHGLEVIERNARVQTRIIQETLGEKKAQGSIAAQSPGARQVAEQDAGTLSP